MRSFRGHRFPVHSVAFSTDDCHVASANQRGQVLIHSIRAEEVGRPRDQQRPVSVLGVVVKETGVKRAPPVRADGRWLADCLAVRR